MEENMFYKAHPLIFKKAEELRNKPTDSEVLLWNYLHENQLGIKFRRQHRLTSLCEIELHRNYSSE